MDDSPSTGSTGSQSDSVSPVTSDAISSSSRRPPPKSRIDREGEAKVLALLKADQKQQAVKLLMELYGDELYAFLVRKMQDAEAAKDVRQQTFLEVYRGIERYEGRDNASLKTWMFTIARNRGIDESKRSRRTEPRDDFDVWKELAVQPDPSMSGEERAKRLALEQCLAKVKEPARSQLLLRLWDEMSYAEIAGIYEVPHGTVQVRISRALPGVQECLRKKGFGR